MTLGLDDDVQVHRRGRTAGLSAWRRRSLLAGAERSGHPDGGDQPLPLRRRRPSGTPRARPPPSGGTRRPPARPADGAAVAPCPRAGPRSSARLSSTERAGSESASRSSGFVDDQVPEREQLVLEPVGLARRRRRPCTAATTPEVLERVAPGRGSPAQRRPTAAATRSTERRAELAVEDLRARARPWPRPAATGRSAPGAGPARATQHVGDAEEVVADAAGVDASSPRRTLSRCGRSASPAAHVGRDSASQGLSDAPPGQPSWHRASPLPSELSRSARNRSTTRLWRASSSRRLPDDAAGERGGQRADLGPQRGDRLLALRLDLGLAVLDDREPPRSGPARASRRRSPRPARAPPRGCARPRAGRRRAAAPARRAWRRPRPAWSRPPARPPSMAAVRSAKVFSKLGHDPLLDGEEQQAEDDQRRG